MAFPSTAILDDFNRAAPLGAKWTTPFSNDAGTGTIVSNQGASDPLGTSTSIGWTGNPAWANGEVYVDVPTLPLTFFQLEARNDVATLGAMDSYLLRVTPGSSTFDIRKRSAGGASTSVLSVAQAFVAGDSAGFSAIGTTLTSYIKHSGTWSQVSQTTDATITAPGYPGVGMQDATIRIDNFGGGALITFRSIIRLQAVNRSSVW